MDKTITVSEEELRTLIASAIHESNKEPKAVVGLSKECAKDNAFELVFDAYKDKVTDIVKCGFGAVMSYLAQFMRLQFMILSLVIVVLLVVVAYLAIKLLNRSLDNMWNNFKIGA